MHNLEKDFEDVYLSAIGERTEDIPWVSAVSGSRDAYDQAWQDIDHARTRLCQRFNLDWEDPDMETLLNGVMVLEKDIARRMFLCGGYSGRAQEA